MTRAGLVQLCSSDDPAENLGETLSLVERAIAAGANFVLTPEVTNCVSTSRARQLAVLSHEDSDPTLRALREVAARRSVWILIGSLALKTADSDGRFANRSLLIGPDGAISARYDKIHMFDVSVSDSETYRESDGYRPGQNVTCVQTPLGKIGLTICYDIRFPQVFQTLGRAGAQIITVPSAFSPITGAAHWETLLRARAIETGAFVLAPAQTGRHSISTKRPRQTHGHSLAVSPWGEVIADGGLETGITLVDLDLREVDDARRRIPALRHGVEFTGP